MIWKRWSTRTGIRREETRQTTREDQEAVEEWMKIRWDESNAKSIRNLKLKSMKKSIWDKILKVVIAVASAIIGALSANAMNV